MLVFFRNFQKHVVYSFQVGARHNYDFRIVHHQGSQDI
jgi:hypothetical protein